MKVEGLKEVQTALRKLPDSTAKGVMRRILKKRAAPVAARARELVPVDTGQHRDNVVVRDSIVVATRLSKRQRRMHKKGGKDDIEVFIGPGPLPHAHMIEFGTGPRYHKKTGKYLGAMSPQPFMRPAWDGEKTGVLIGLKDDLWAEIRKTVARVRKRAIRKATGRR